MFIENFCKKNNLHNKKYIVKGFVSDKEFVSIAYCLERNDKRKFVLYLKTMPSVRLFDLVEVENFDEQFNFEVDKYYKPLGYLEASFFIERQTDQRLTSNIFDVIPDGNSFCFKFNDLDRFFEVSKEEFKSVVNDSIWVPSEVIVHNGVMHADDILCVSLLKYIRNDIKVYRTREIPEDFKGVVCDVGDGRYDHHKHDKFRFGPDKMQLFLPTGEPEVYAAFGLLAKDILPGLIGSKSYFLVDHQIIRALDSADNYGTFSDLAYYFSLFNPLWNSTKSSDECFLEAVDRGLDFITKIVEKEKTRQASMPYVQSKIAKTKDKILVLEYRAPWQSLAKKADILFAVFPTDDGLFALQSTPSKNADARSKINKVDMPQEWLENPPTGCKFVHQTLFFATFKTLEDAIEAAKIAIRDGKYNE